MRWKVRTRGSKGCKPDRKMRVIVLMLAQGHQVGSTDPTLVCPGWPCVPLDAWSVAVTSIFWMVQNLRSTDPTFGSIFGVTTQVCAPDQRACFVSSSDDIGGSADPPHLGFSVFWISTTRRDVTCTCLAGGNTPAELKSYFIQIKLFIQEFKYCRHFYIWEKGKIKREIELKKSKWNNSN